MLFCFGDFQDFEGFLEENGDDKLPELLKAGFLLLAISEASNLSKHQVL